MSISCKNHVKLETVEGMLHVWTPIFHIVGIPMAFVSTRIVVAGFLFQTHLKWVYDYSGTCPILFPWYSQYIPIKLMSLNYIELLQFLNSMAFPLNPNPRDY